MSRTLKEEFTNKRGAKNGGVIKLHVEVTPGLHRGFQSGLLTHQWEDCPQILLDVCLFE